MPAAVSAANASFNIFPTKPVDERLFLVQALAQMYNICLGDAQNTKAFNADVSVYRPIASRLLRHIYNQNLGDRLATLYSGYLKNMDSLKNYNESIAANMSEANAARRDAQGRLFIRNFGTGFAAGGIANAHPVVAVGSILYGLYKAWKANEQSDQNISDAERVAINAARRNLRDNVKPRLMHAQALVNQLTNQYGWKAGSTGFEMDVARDSRSMEDQMKKCDPFYTLDQVSHQLRQLTEIMESNNSFFAPAGFSISIYNTESCLKAEQMIPSNHIYNYFRFQTLFAAASSALVARGCEVNLGIKPLSSTVVSQIDVGLWRMVVQCDSSDLDCELEAVSLIEDNDLGAAMAIANKLTTPLGSDPAFCYCYACLCSRVGSFDYAMNWLTSAIASGYPLNGDYTDPNLAALKEAHPNQFHNLLYPSAAYGVTLGHFIGDDAVLTNNSRFTITNVALTITTSSGATLTLKVPEIPPGGTKTWSNCTNPGVLKGSTATFNCDQLQEINRDKNHTELAKENDITKNRIVTGDDGRLHSAPGYSWVLPSDPENFRVISGSDANNIGLALMRIGLFFSRGRAAQTADYDGALSWYRKAAAAGNGDSMYNIGLIYYNGQGVSQDNAKAMEWFRKAEQSGDLQAGPLAAKAIQQMQTGN